MLLQTAKHLAYSPPKDEVETILEVSHQRFANSFIAFNLPDLFSSTVVARYFKPLPAVAGTIEAMLDTNTFHEYNIMSHPWKGGGFYGGGFKVFNRPYEGLKAILENKSIVPHIPTSPAKIIIKGGRKVIHFKNGWGVRYVAMLSPEHFAKIETHNFAYVFVGTNAQKSVCFTAAINPNFLKTPDYRWKLHKINMKRDILLKQAKFPSFIERHYKKIGKLLDREENLIDITPSIEQLDHMMQSVELK